MRCNEWELLRKSMHEKVLRPSDDYSWRRWRYHSLLSSSVYILILYNNYCEFFDAIWTRKYLNSHQLLNIVVWWNVSFECLIKKLNVSFRRITGFTLYELVLSAFIDLSILVNFKLNLPNLRSLSHTKILFGRESVRREWGNRRDFDWTLLPF